MKYKSNVLNDKKVPLDYCVGNSIHHSFITNLTPSFVGQTSEGCSLHISKECSKGDNFNTKKACNLAMRNKDTHTPIYSYINDNSTNVANIDGTTRENFLVETFLRKHAVLNSKCKVNYREVIEHLSTEKVEYYTGFGCGIKTFVGLGDTLINNIDNHQIIHELLTHKPSYYVVMKLFKPLVETGFALPNSKVYHIYQKTKNKF